MAARRFQGFESKGVVLITTGTVNFNRGGENHDSSFSPETRYFRLKKTSLKARGIALLSNLPTPNLQQSP